MTEAVDRCRKKLTELAEGFELTWVRLAVFSGIMGIVTALCALLAPHRCSLYNISQSAELWIVLVLVIAMKSRKDTDAALMAGGMMFCAHFLAAMIKTPFNRAAPEEFIGWVPVIVCSVPYAYFAAKFLREKGEGKIWLLSATAGVLVIYGVMHFKAFVGRPVYQLAAMLFCFGATFLIMYELASEKRSRIIVSAVCGTALVFGAVFAFMHTYRYSCVVLLDSAKYPLTEKWKVEAEDTDISTPSIEQGADDAAVLEVTFYEEGDNTYTLTSPDGEEMQIVVRYDDEYGVNVYEKK